MSRRLIAKLFATCLLGLATAVVFVACSNSPVEQATCSTDADCTAPQVCQDGYCVRPTDETAPQVSWVSPENQSVVNGEVTLAVDVTEEETSVQQVIFELDDQAQTLGTDSDPSDGWQTTWNTEQAQNFQYTLTARAVDAVGNEGSASVTVTVDNSVPSVEIVRPQMGQIIKGNTDTENGSGFTVEWCIPEQQPLLAANPFDIRYRGPDDASFAPASTMMGNDALGLSFNQDGPDCSDSVMETQPLQTFQWAVPEDSGTAFLEVAAETQAGQSTQTRQTFVVDSNFPTFGEPPLSRSGGDDIPLSGESISGTVDLTADVSDPTSSVSEVTFIIEDSGETMVYSETDDTPDDGFTATWNTQPNAGAVADGEYTIDLNATDVVGHTATTRPDNGGEGLTTTVTVDNGGPAVTVTNPSDNDIVSGDSQAVEATVSDMSTSVAEVELLVNGNSIETKNSNNASFSWNTNQTNNGSTTVTVRAVDTEGNTASDSVNVTVDNEPPQSFSISNINANSFVGGSGVTIEASTTDQHTSVADYQLLVDGSSVTTQSGQSASFNWDSTTVSDGAHTLAVRATDEAGNERETSPVPVTVDNTAPDVVQISQPADNSTVTGMVDVSANASDQTGTVQTLELIAPNGTVATKSGTSANYMWDSTQTSSGTGKSLTVTATDQVGNSASTSITVTVDNEAPTLNVTAPSPGALVSGASVTVEANASDSLDSVDSISLSDANGNVGTQNGSSASFSWDSTTVNDGSHTLTFEASDTLGNMTTTTRSVTVDNTDPTVNITSHSNNDQVSGDVTFTASGSDTNNVSYTFEVAGTTLSGSGSSQIWDSTNAPNGTVTLTVTATDDAGNTASESITLTVDNGKPTANITNPSAGVTVSDTVTITGSGSDSTTSVTTTAVSIDGTQIESTSGSSINTNWNTNNYSNGDHTIEVKTTDELGNTQTATITVTVDNGDPNGSFTSPSSGASVGGTINVTVSASDTYSNVTSVTLDDSAGQVGSASSGGSQTFNWDTNRVGDGSATLTLEVTDAQGNTASFTHNVTVDNTDPSNVQFNSPAPNTTVGGNVTVTVEASDATSGISDIELQDATGTVGNSGSNPATFSWDSTRVADGSATLDAVATDGAGNTATTSLTVTVDNTAPNITISDPSAGTFVNGSVNIQASATDSNSVTNMTIEIDSMQQTTSSSDSISDMWDTTMETDGTHTITVTATDSVGNQRITSINVEVDNSPPSMLSFDNLSTDQLVGGQFDVSVSATDALSGMASLSLDDQDGDVGSTGGASGLISWDTTTVSDGTHTLTLTATDSQGNSTNTTIDVVVDNSDPGSVSFTNPSDGNTVSGTSVAVDITASDATSSIASIKLQDPNTSYTSTSNPANFSWDSTSVSDGQITLTAIATDEAGNTSQTSINVTVDNTGPDNIDFDNLNPDDFVNGTVNVDASASDDLSSVTSIEFQGPGSYTETISGDNGTATWDSTAVSDGTQTLTLIATDSQGNTNSNTLDVNVDNNGPIITITSHSDGDTVSGGSVSVSASATDAGSSVDSMTLDIDRNEEATSNDSSVSTTWDTTTDPDGEVEILVQATDENGNTSTQSIIVNVDNVPPSVSASTASTCVSQGAMISIDITPTHYVTPESNTNNDLDVDVIYNGSSDEFIQSSGSWSNGSAFTINWTAPNTNVAASDLVINLEDTNYEDPNEDDESQDIIENFQVGNCP